MYPPLQDQKANPSMSLEPYGSGHTYLIQDFLLLSLRFASMIIWFIMTAIPLFQEKKREWLSGTGVTCLGFQPVSNNTFLITLASPNSPCLSFPICKMGIV